MVRLPISISARTCLFCLGLIHMALFLQGAKVPNILLIVSEDNGPELGCYGDRYARTPNLDRLASQGLQFNRAYVPQAGCSQSRASFLTGLYPHQHGQIGLATWNFRLYRKDTANLPRQLKAAGYRTGLIGKLHINPAEAFPFDIHEIPSANFQREHLADYARHAEAFMRADESPFFLSVNYPDPHDPWLRQVDGLPRNPQTGSEVRAMPYMGIDPPDAREMIADYYNCLSRMDTLVGDLLKALDDCGKARDTLVVYFGDHGADMWRGKRTCYEGGLRIPLLVRWPGQIVPQMREELVSTIDLLPTLLAAARAHPVEDVPGRAWQPLFKPGHVSWRSHLFAEYHMHAANNFFPQRVVVDQRFKLIENLLPGEVHPDFALTLRKMAGEVRLASPQASLDYLKVIDEAPPNIREAYQRMRQPPRYELYDLFADPYEFTNLAEDTHHREIFLTLKQTLHSWRVQSDDPLLKSENVARLKAEVHGVPNKKAAKQQAWKYPQYFFPTITPSHAAPLDPGS